MTIDIQSKRTTTIGIRELARGSSMLKNFDYISIEDKKNTSTQRFNRV